MVDQQTKEFLEKLMDEAMKPNFNEMRRIWRYGDVAVLFWKLAPGAEQAARDLGWSGGDGPQVRRMKAKEAERVARNIQRTHPHDGAIAWLRRGGPGRLFVFNGNGTLCLNYDADMAAWGPAPQTLGVGVPN